jgi:hypothetical protein
MGGSGSSVAAKATVFAGLDSQSAAEANVQHVVPVGMTFTKFYCFGPKPTAGAEDVFTVRINGASQTAKCSIPTGGSTVVVATVSVAVSAGSLLDVQVAQGNTAGAITWALAP